MLRWRLILGFAFVAALAGLCWADAQIPKPGSILGILAVIVTWLCASELLAMFRARGYQPAAWAFYSGALAPVILSCVPIRRFEITANYTMGALGWLAVGLAFGLVIAFVGEMKRFEGAGKSIVNVAVTAFGVLYIGGCMGTIVQLRLVRAPLPIDGLRGLLPLLTFIATIKLSDIGQFTVGRLFGRHKLAPKLSPGKTWEGAIGGIALSCFLISLAITLRIYGRERFEWKFLEAPLLYTAMVTIAGMIGDLSESLLKRDAGLKDSSTWMPGFGGVLDMMDSLLLSAPFAYLWFVNGFLDLDPLADISTKLPFQ